MEIPRHAEFRDLEVLDYLAVLWPWMSRRALIDLLARGRVRSGGRPVGARRIVGEIEDLTLHGDVGDAADPRALAASGVVRDIADPDAFAVRVLHEDGRLVVLGKPSGVPVIPDRSRSRPSCLEILTRRELSERPSKPVSEYVRFRTVHRIDRLTSGLVILAKTPEAERRLAADFEHRRVHKEYLAILSGTVLPARIVVNCPVVPGRKGKMRAAPEGAPADLSRKGALTRFDVLERWEGATPAQGATLVLAVPHTGRTHQIRVHAWAAGHPLAIDPLYGGRPPPGLPGIDRLTLHAWRIALPEDWEEPRSFECPVPEDFQAAIEALRAGRAAER